MASADKAASPEAGSAGFSSRPGLKKQDIASMPRPGTFQDLAAATAGTSAGLGM